MSTFISATRKMGLWYGLIVAATLLLVPAVASATTIGNSITVTNDVTINGNVTTTNATSSGYMDIGGKLANSNASYTNGDLNVGNRLAVDGATFVSSTLDVTGVAVFWNTVRSGGNDSQDLGAYGNAWNELFVSGTSYIDGVSTTGGLYPTANNNNTLDLGGNGAAWRDVFVSSSLTIGSVSTTASSTAIIGVLSNLSAGIDFVDVASTSMKCTNSSNTAGGDVTVTGTTLGDLVTVAPTICDDAFTSGTLQAFVVDMNKVRIMYCGSGHSTVAQDRDPVTQRYRVTVWKF